MAALWFDEPEKNNTLEPWDASRAKTRKDPKNNKSDESALSARRKSLLGKIH